MPKHPPTQRAEAARFPIRMILCIGLISLLGCLFWKGQTSAFDGPCHAPMTNASAQMAGFPAAVEIHTVGQATGIHQTNHQDDSAWAFGRGDFTLTGRGFVMGQFVVTAAHVIHPSKVDLQPNPHRTTASSVVTVDQLRISIGAPIDAGGIPADIIHLNHRFDLAILRPARPLSYPVQPYHASATWWSETSAEANSLLHPGNCVVALAAKRDAHQSILPGSAARAGQVVAPHAESSEASVVASLNANTITISTPLFPGDSGSPVIAFDAGKPRLVGVVIATRYPFESLSYVSRLDPILPILAALHAPLEVPARVASAH